MANREELDKLKNRRATFKGLVNNRRKNTEEAINNYVVATDPSLVEAYFSNYDEYYVKYKETDEEILLHPDHDDKDNDKEFKKVTDLYLGTKVYVHGLRKDYDKSLIQPVVAQQPAGGGGGQVKPPKIDYNKPPTLREDTDLRAFIRWKPLWENYSRLAELSKITREQRVSLFWQCCSPGFLQTINHSLGIKIDTGRDVADIHQIIEQHLRSLRSIHTDMQVLLAVRQRNNQDFTSLCNEIKEKSSYADTTNITEDILLIAILLQAIENEEITTELLQKKPQTFDQARKYILELECARKTAMAMGKPLGVNKNRSTYKNDQKNGFGQGTRESRNDENPTPPAGQRKCGKCKKMLPPKQLPWHTDCNECFRASKTKPPIPKKPGPKKNNSKPKDTANLGAVKIARNESENSNQESVEIDFKPRNLKKKGSFGTQRRSFTISCCPDTGAETMVMGIKDFEESGLDKEVYLKKTNPLVIHGINGIPLKQRGFFFTDLMLENHKSLQVRVTVLEDITGTFLSLQACKDLKIVPESFPRPMSCAALNSERIQVDGTVQPDVQEEEKYIPVWPQKEQEEWLSKLPIDPTPEEISKITEDIKKRYQEVFDETMLKTMKGPIVGEPMKITLKEDAIPYAIHTARPIPYPMREKFSAEFKKMEQNGIIARTGDVPTEWCHPTQVVWKQDGNVRITADLTKLNAQVKRSTHPTLTPQQAVRGFKASNKFFCKMDLLKGYWQMALDEESQKYTTSICPIEGKYVWLRSPMGFVSTGDSYSYRGDVALAGLEVNKVVDDLAFGADTYQDLMRKQLQVLERCARYGLTVNAKKSVLAGAKKIEFVGYDISKNSIKPNKRKINAITDFKIPVNRTDLRSFTSLANQLGEHSPDLAFAAEPLRDLLKTKNEFRWLPDHTEAFNNVKNVLTSSQSLGMFNSQAQTLLETDASRTGLGFILKQNQGGRWKWIQAGSRFLTDAETRYAMVELEALGVFYAIKKCHLFLAGLEHFEVITDHKPLVPMFNNQMLPYIENPRVQNYRSKLTGYNFTLVWKKGKEHLVPDALSRAPVDDPEEEDLEDLCFRMASVSKVEDSVMTELKKKAKEDKNYQDLIKALKEDSLSKQKGNSYLKRFRPFAHLLSVEDGLVYKGICVVIPNNNIKEILQELHRAHQGIVKTKKRARQSVFWPGITKDIEMMVKNCESCALHRPTNQLEPLIQEDEPARPFEMATADLCTVGKKKFLVYADRYSGFPLVTQWHREPTSHQVITVLRKCFSLMGTPNTFRSDNGPQFSAHKTQKFLEDWGVTWKPSSPENPQSNGHAESMIKNVKNLILKCEGDFDSDEFQKGLLELRNSPRVDGQSPAQRLFGRPLRSKMPIDWRHYDKKWKDAFEEADKMLEKAKHLQRKHFNKKARSLPKLCVGDNVLVQDTKSGKWSKKATIVDSGGKDGRRYQLRFPSGRVLWRNRHFLSKAPAVTN